MEREHECLGCGRPLGKWKELCPPCRVSNREQQTCPECGTPSPERKPGARGPAPLFHPRCKRRAEKRKARKRNGGNAAILPLSGGTNGQWIASYYEAMALDPCVYCGSASEVTDHVEPWSYHGASDWTNLAPSCSACNASKGRRSLLGFLLWRAYEPERTLLSRVEAMRRPVTRENTGQSRTNGARRARRRLIA